MRDTTDFTPDNDPYGEHDFGTLMLGHTKCFWKIDYYALDMTARRTRPTTPSRDG